MARGTKTNVEVSLVSVELTGVPEKRLLKSRHLATVDLVWPRTGVAKKTAARQVDLRLGKADFSAEPWTKRVLFREEIEGCCGLVAAVSDALTVQKIRRYLKLLMRYALKEGADIVGSAAVGYADIAGAPLDALAAMIGQTEQPKTVAQGVLDVTDLPGEGETRTCVVPLVRPLTGKAIGSLTVCLRG